MSIKIPHQIIAADSINLGEYLNKSLQFTSFFVKTLLFYGALYVKILINSDPNTFNPTIKHITNNLPKPKKTRYYVRP